MVSVFWEIGLGTIHGTVSHPCRKFLALRSPHAAPSKTERGVSGGLLGGAAGAGLGAMTGTSTLGGAALGGAAGAATGVLTAPKKNKN